jgi:hypothetical protein
MATTTAAVAAMAAVIVATGTAMAAVVAMGTAMAATMAASMTAVAGTKTTAATVMAGDTDNNQLNLFSKGCTIFWCQYVVFGRGRTIFLVGGFC